MESLIPDVLKMPLAVGAMQLPGMLMRHQERMQEQKVEAAMQMQAAASMEKFMSQMAEGINTW